MRSLRTSFRCLHFRLKSLLWYLLPALVVTCYFVYFRGGGTRWLVSWPKLPLTFNNDDHQHERPLKLVDMGQYKVFEYEDQFGKPCTYNASRAVLIFSEHSQSLVVERIKMLLEAQRILYEVIIWNRLKDDLLVLPRLITSRGFVKYSAFLFDNSEVYAKMDEWNKEILQDFCLRFGVGILVLWNSEAMNSTLGKPGEALQFEPLPLWTRAGISNLERVELNTDSDLFRITKASAVYEEKLPFKEHVIFYSDDPSFQALAYSYRKEELQSPNRGTISESVQSQSSLKKYITIMHDTGKHDGVQKVFWGASPVNFWLYQVIFLDALTRVSRGILGQSLERYIQIDVDDIFVAIRGTRMLKADVLAFLESQKRIAARIPNFQFNLGFSGHFFLNGTPEENEGDREIIKHASQFRWFCHMFHHIQPHKLDSPHLLKIQMKRNKDFASLHNIPVDPTYAVAPHHSGVYPVHEPLYEAWKTVWGVQVTSTEEYPHLHPSWHRKGFIFHNLKVLPRQTCGLFTKTLHFATYPGGKGRLDKSIYGGELFFTFLNNPVAIFMTHFGNYGSDRLASYTFENVITFIQKWTNLKLISKPPLELGNIYFDLFPQDTDPVWSNPCNDSRQRGIWAASKSCNQLPKFLIVGPQKSGTAALYTFLSMHPQLQGNHRSAISYEEVQFFNKDSYFKGLDWYMDFFPAKTGKEEVIYFEKSANYFDSIKAPERMQALLPQAKLIVILIEPGKRAYSWYQHMRSKKDPIATTHSFYDVIMGNNQTDDPKFQLLRMRCLRPGLYAEHLERWLRYYSADQILLLDGDVLREVPVKALKEVQQFLGLTWFNYRNRIKFDRNKGFYCPVGKDGTVSCLGQGKGRKYRKMDAGSRQQLNEYYHLPNMWLADVLDLMKRKYPAWLRKGLK